MSFYTKKNSWLIFMALVFITLTFSMTLTASPLQDDLIGKWTGIVTDEKDGIVAIDLTIKPDANTQNAYIYSLHYGTPKKCRLETEELSVEDNTIILKFKGASDLKYCMVLFKDNATLTITVKRDNKLNLLIESRSGFKQTTTLKKK